MSKVDFTYSKTGRVKTMAKSYADVLEKLGHGTYQTRDMVAARPEPLIDRQIVPETPRRRGRPPSVKPAEPVQSIDPAPEVVAPVEPVIEQVEGQESKSEE